MVTVPPGAAQPAATRNILYTLKIKMKTMGKIFASTFDDKQMFEPTQSTRQIEHFESLLQTQFGFFPWILTPSDLWILDQLLSS